MATRGISPWKRTGARAVRFPKIYCTARKAVPSLSAVKKRRDCVYRVCERCWRECNKDLCWQAYADEERIVLAEVGETRAAEQYNPLLVFVTYLVERTVSEFVIDGNTLTFS